jgi:hypothetical protein
MFNRAEPPKFLLRKWGSGAGGSLAPQVVAEQTKESMVIRARWSAPTSNGALRCRHLHDGWLEWPASCAEWGRPLATRLCGVPRDREDTPGGTPGKPALDSVAFITCLHTAPGTDFAVHSVRYQRLARRVNKTLSYVSVNVTFTNVVVTALWVTLLEYCLWNAGNATACLHKIISF